MSDETHDPFLWLEEVEGEAALAWVERENARSLAELEGDPRYAELLAEATRDLTASDRLPVIELIGSDVYDLLQDSEHVRGLLRRTPLADFATGDPGWEAVLDVDALCAQEGASWVYRGLEVLAPENRRAMVALSPGGSDASVLREFDLEERAFVQGGFEIPECKSNVAWFDDSTLLVAAATSPEDTTRSGYGRIVAAWRRREPFDARKALFEVPPDHVWAIPLAIWADGARHVLYLDGRSFFDWGYHYVGDDFAAKPLPLPDGFKLSTLHQRRLIGSLRNDLRQGDRTVERGALVAFDLDALLRSDSPAEAEVVFEPDESQALQTALGTAVATKGRVYFTVLEDVVGKLIAAVRSDTGWSTAAVDLPGNGAVNVVAGNDAADAVIVRYEDFLTPPSLYVVRRGAPPELAQSLEPKFDAAGLKTVQHFAESRDGTRIPYFVTGPFDLAPEGTTPALIGAYGGFGIALTPQYAGSFGNGLPFKTMVTRGGLYVNANLRGGGEYGPRWHEAGLFEHRQRVYDDFHAVAQDVVRRGYTSPDELGIVGASNSGLLTGVAFTQRPELYHTVICGVPLLDMRRYHELLAGASWMGEYGDPDDPAMWQAIRRYSPYHNLRADGDYPEVFFFGSTKDDRVHPGHMRKMAALMKEQGHDFLYFENTEGGHGAAADLNQSARLQALQAVYLLRRLFR